jgi:hypothetical protein
MTFVIERVINHHNNRSIGATVSFNGSVEKVIEALLLDEKGLASAWSGPRRSERIAFGWTNKACTTGWMDGWPAGGPEEKITEIYASFRFSTNHATLIEDGKRAILLANSNLRID